MKELWNFAINEAFDLSDLKLRIASPSVLIGSASLLCSLTYSAKELISSSYKGEFDATTTASLAFLIATTLTMSRSRTLRLISSLVKLFAPLMLLSCTENPSVLYMATFFLGIWYFIIAKSRTASLVYILAPFVLLQIFLKSSELSQQTPQLQLEILTRNFIKLMVYTFGVLVYQKCLDFHFQRELISHCKALETRCNDLEKKEEKLEESLKNNKTLLLTFSHEFKNALNGLLGSLQIVSESDIEPRLRKILQSANVCGSILKTIAQNLLDSGKFEQEKLEVDCTRTNMGEFISNFWQVSAELIRNKKLRGFVKVSKDVPDNLMIDKQKLYQVLLNLTSNSVKFTEKGHVYFLVDWVLVQDESTPTTIIETHQKLPSLASTDETEEHDDHQGPIKMPRSKTNTKFLTNSSITLDFEKRSLDPNEKLSGELKPRHSGILKISVVDSGSGMNEEDKDKLFKKFSQVSEKVSERNQGTGLGLWITAELVKLMGGEIKVATKKGKGTIFEVFIKAETPGSHASISTESNRTSLLRRSTDFCGSHQKFFVSAGKTATGKVLIADDDSFNLTILQSHLAKLGREVIVANDGQELIEQFGRNSEKIVAVITDNQMPRKKGSEASREIKKYIEENQLANVPIFMLSGDDNAIPLDKLGEYGISEVIPKPIDFRCIEKLIMNLKS